MRHRKKINSLGRKAAHRKATLSSLATALILNKRINTTVAKAKALRVYVEPLITKSKEDSTHSRRTVFSYLKNKYAVSELFREISQKVADRPGGYTRILKTGFRKGDGAEMCFIELVDYNAHMLQTEEDTQQKRTRRGRRRGKKDGEESTVAEQTKKSSQKTDKEEPVKEDEGQTADMETKAEAPKSAEAEVQEQPEASADTTTPSKEEPFEKEEAVAEEKLPEDKPAEPEADTSEQKEEEPTETKKEDQSDNKKQEK